MPFFFDPTPTGAFGGDEFAISVFDDPFDVKGDRAEFQVQGGAFKPGAAPAVPPPGRWPWRVARSRRGNCWPR